MVSNFKLLIAAIIDFLYFAIETKISNISSSSCSGSSSLLGLWLRSKCSFCSGKIDLFLEGYCLQQRLFQFLHYRSEVGLLSPSKNRPCIALPQGFGSHFLKEIFFYLLSIHVFFTCVIYYIYIFLRAVFQQKQGRVRFWAPEDCQVMSQPPQRGFVQLLI